MNLKDILSALNEGAGSEFEDPDDSWKKTWKRKRRADNDEISTAIANVIKSGKFKADAEVAKAVIKRLSAGGMRAGYDMVVGIIKKDFK